MRLFILLFLLVFTSTTFAQLTEVKEWQSIFSNHEVDGTFVLKDLNTGLVKVHNEARSQKQFVPASSFKILNSLIALQEGAVGSVTDTIKWDGVSRNIKVWNRDHTMQTAFKVSCVWFYQELARRIGESQMQSWLNAVNYGNCTIENNIDRFWLEGKLEISAVEQIAFIEKLVNLDLPFDKTVLQDVQSIMLSDFEENYSVFSKTGWDGEVGWYVGYVTTSMNTWVFALNMDLYDMKNAKLRQTLAYELLSEQGIVK